MKKLTILYIIASIIILSISALKFFNIFDAGGLSLLIVLFVSIHQSSHISKQNKRITELESNEAIT